MKIRDRIRELRRVAAKDLRPNPKNWRTHPPAQADALRGVLAEIGFADAAIARELPDGSLMLIDGHLRTETAGDAMIPVLVLDVTEEEADKILVTLDPLAGMAEQDSSQLASLLGELKERQDTLAAMVWPDYIIDPLLSADWTPPEPGEMPGRDEKPKRDVLVLTPEQREAVAEAVKKCRGFHEQPEMTEGECVEIICRGYLDAKGG